MEIPVDSINAREIFGLNPAKKKSELNMETFMRLLTVQLANQNPLEPMNDRDFFAQMAQLGQVEGTDKMLDKLNVLQASSLIGKTVDAVRPMTDTGSEGVTSIVTGTVTRMTVKNGEYYLGLKQADGGVVEVKFDAIQEVRA